VVEDEDHPVLRSQPVERAADRVVVDELVLPRSRAQVRRRFGLWRFIAGKCRSDRYLAEPDTMPARRQGGVGDDPVEPAVEGRRGAQAGELPPSRDERVLGRVSRIGLVRQDRPREAVAAIDPSTDEDPERRRVARACASNQCVVGRRRRVCRFRQRIHVTLEPVDPSARLVRCR
jgi:hypothetical protein